MAQTITEKIFSEHVGHQVFAGEIIRSNIDMVIGNDITTPISIKAFEDSGAEFIIILSDILKDEVLRKVDQIRIDIQNTSFACKGENITISAGISFGTKSDDIREIMEHSDSALYMAKNAGRNCVRVFEAG